MSLQNVEDWYHMLKAYWVKPLPDWFANSGANKNMICISFIVGSLHVPAGKPASEYAWHPVAGDAKTDELLAAVYPQACAQFE